jgi:hypothetical protein
MCKCLAALPLMIQKLPFPKNVPATQSSVLVKSREVFENVK